MQRVNCFNLEKMNYKFLVFLVIIPTFFLNCTSIKSADTRITEDFNFGWKFHLGAIEDIESKPTDDSEWTDIRLPHDWSVEHPFTQENASGATAFLPGGIGWYKKTFVVPENISNKITWIEFDGIYSNSEVWINGKYLGKHPYGYTPFKYELTEYLKYGEENEIVIKVDRSAYIDCRWYPGSGIYRNVKLVTTNKAYIPQWGTFVSTPKVSDAKATVAIQTEIANRFENEKSAILKTKILYEGKEVASIQSKIELKTGELNTVQQEIPVENPNMWDIEHPHIYKAVSQIIVDTDIVDSYETPFGIRSFSFDKDKGFFLNGKNTFLKGVCLHHDGGLVGAAVPIGVWERRLQTLKDAGCNAIRTAHNPPSSAFLDLCDRMGFLVQDEAFDEWNNPKDKRHNYNQQKASPLTRGYTEHFTEWSERDVKSMVLRDRNHPSIIMWSIGNEIEWTYPGYEKATGYWGENKVGDVNYYWDAPPFSIEDIKKNFESAKKGKYDLATTANKLSKWVKELDTTRPVTANLVIPSVSNFSGYTDALDIVGLSYRQSVYDYVRLNYPDKIFLGTENWTRYHEWKPVLEKEFISGIFLWTGINYMGESRGWPKKGNSSGLLDFAGFKKPSYHMFKTLWSDEPHIHMTTQLIEKSPYKLDGKTKQLVEKEKDWTNRQKWGWQDVNEHWNYSKEEEVIVEVYTNQSEVELFLNEKSLGIQKLKDQKDHILKWLVPYSNGKLTARAIGVSKIEKTVRTTLNFAKIILKTDKTELQANGYDIVHFTLQLADEKGNPIKHEDKEVVFHIDGDAKLLGVDNGSPYNVQKYQNNRLVTHNGKALMILQSNLKTSTVKVTASCGDIYSEMITLTIK